MLSSSFLSLESRELKIKRQNAEIKQITEKNHFESRLHGIKENVELLWARMTKRLREVFGGEMRAEIRTMLQELAWRVMVFIDFWLTQSTTNKISLCRSNFFFFQFLFDKRFGFWGCYLNRLRIIFGFYLNVEGLRCHSLQISAMKSYRPLSLFWANWASITISLYKNYRNIFRWLVFKF